jgi:filamentous hemagglutinin family protein
MRALFVCIVHTLVFSIAFLPAVGFAQQNKFIPIPGLYKSVNNLPVLSNPNELPDLQEIQQGISGINTSGNMMEINQDRNKAIIEWNTFNIGEDATVQFNQPTGGEALNRIHDLNPSKIYGTLRADGSVFLINQNGVVFGPNSQTDVGALVASSLNISNDTFLNLSGVSRFESQQINPLDPDGSIVDSGISNYGKISADEYVVFNGPLIENNGEITCPGGRIFLSAGSRATYTNNFGDIESLDPVDDATRAELQSEGGEAQVINNGDLIVENDGASAGSINIWGTVVNQNGRISAVSTTSEAGRINLRADKKISIGDESQILADTVNPGNLPFDPADIDGSEIELIAQIEAEIGGIISAPSGEITISQERAASEQGTPVPGITIRPGTRISAAGSGFGPGGSIQISSQDGSIVVDDTASFNVDGTNWGDEPVDVFNTAVLTDAQILSLSADPAFRGLNRDGLQATLDAGSLELKAAAGVEIGNAELSGQQQRAIARNWDIPFTGESEDATFGGIAWNLQGDDGLIGVGGSIDFQTNSFADAAPLSGGPAASLSLDEFLQKIQSSGFNNKVEIAAADAGGLLTIGENTLVEVNAFDFSSNDALKVEGAIVSNTISLSAKELDFNGIIQASRSHFDVVQISLFGEDRLSTSEDSILLVSVSEDPALQDKSFLPQQTLISLKSDGLIDHKGKIQAPGAGSENELTSGVVGTGVELIAPRVYLDAGSVIDVSGNDLSESFEDNQLEVQLNSNELRDFVNQRLGVLRGETITTNQIFGSNIGELSGALSSERLTAQQQSTKGGRIFLGDINTEYVIVREGAVLDVSGGTRETEGGAFEETQLISGNQFVGISNADPNIIYDDIIGPGNEQMVTFERFGVEEAYGLNSGGTSPVRNLVARFVEGDEAGGIRVIGRGVNLNGDIQGAATLGIYQTQVVSSGGLEGDRLPAPGYLTIGASQNDGNFNTNFVTEDFTISRTNSDREAVLISQNFDPLTDPYPFTVEHNGNTFLASFIGADTINNSGISALEVFANAKITVEEDASVQLAPGGVNEGWQRNNAARTDTVGLLSFTSGSMEILGQLKAPSSFMNFRLFENQSSSDNANADSSKRSGLSPQIFIGDKAVIDAGGEDVFLTAGAFQNSVPPSVRVEGGNIVLRTDNVDVANVAGIRQGEVLVKEGARISVDGGFLVGGDGEILAAGNAGTFEVSTNSAVLDGNITGRSLLGQDGGSFILQSDFTLVQKDEAPPLPGEFAYGDEIPEEYVALLDSAKSELFEQGNRNIGGYIFSQNRLVGSGFSTVDLGSITTVKVEDNLNLTPSYTKLAQPDLFTTQGVSSPVQNNLGGVVGVQSVNPDGTIEADPLFAGRSGFAITSSVGEDLNQLQIIFSSDFGRGTNIQVAPKGRIELTAFGASDFGGATFQGNLSAPGGEIVLGAGVQLAIGDNSRIDASGILIPPAMTSPGQFNPGPEVIDGGSIRLANVASYGENVVLDVSGSPVARKFFQNVDNTIGSFNAAGAAGSITEDVAPDLQGEATYSAQTFLPNVTGGSFTRSIGLSSDTTAILGELELDQVFVASLVDAGFDDLSFIAENLRITKDTTINVPRKLTLDAREILVSDDVVAEIRAPWLRLQGSAQFFERLADVVDDPASGTGNLLFQGDWLDVEAIMAISGVESTTFIANNDIRLSDVDLGRDFGGIQFLGQLVVSGDLAMQADRIYPTTNDVFTIAAADSFTLLRNSDAVDSPIYSAGGSLSIESPVIDIMGTIAAPIGKITLDAGDDGIVTLAENAVLTTKGEVPTRFGNQLNDVFWTFDDKALGVQNIELTEVPGKSVSLNGALVETEEGSLIDISGGGSIYITQFLGSAEGSQNPLTEPGVAVVIPGDPFNFPGEAITFNEGNDLLPAGTYSLLPPEFAFLEGAVVIIDLAAAGETFVPGQEFSQLGYPIISGSPTEKGTSIQNNAPLGYAVRPADDVLEEGFFNFATAQAGASGEVIYNGDRNLIQGDSATAAVEVFDRGILYGDDSTLTASAEFKVEGRTFTNSDSIPTWYLGYLDLFAVPETNNLESAQDYLAGVLMTEESLSDRETNLLSQAIADAESAAVSPLATQQDFLAANLEFSEELTQDDFEAVSTILTDANRVRPFAGGVVNLNGNQVIFTTQEGLGALPALEGEDLRTIIVADTLNEGGFDELRIDTGSSPGEERFILVDDDTLLQINRIVFRADDAITLGDNAQVAAADTLSVTTEDGTLQLGTDSLLRAGNEVSLNIAEIKGDIDIAVDNGVLNLQASGGEAPIFYVQNGMEESFAEQGLVLSEADWTGRFDALSISATEMILVGEVGLESTDLLRLDISAYDSGSQDSNALFRSDTIEIFNTGPLRDNFQTLGRGALAFEADTVRVGRGSLDFDGFDQLVINGRDELLIQGVGSLGSEGDIRLAAATIASQAYRDEDIDFLVTDFVVETPGNLVFADSSGQSTLDANFGGSLSARADTITFESGSNLSVPAGLISLEAQNGISVADGATINVAGEVLSRQIASNTIIESASGGRLTLVTVNNDILVGTGAQIDVGHTGTLADIAGLSQEGREKLTRSRAFDAGSLELTSLNGDVLLEGSLTGDSALGTGGAFTVNTGNLEDINSLVADFQAGGFASAFNVRTRNGNVQLNSDLTADKISITADNGDMVINSAIDASLKAGGRVFLNAGKDIILNNTLLVNSNEEQQALIDLHSADGRIDLSENARINALGGGNIVFRAKQDGNDVAVDLDGSIQGATSVKVLAEAVYLDDTISTGDIAVIESETDAYMANADAVEARLLAGLDISPDTSFALNPSIVIQSDDDLVLQDDWDLSSIRYGADERIGTLTLRAAGNVVIDGILQDKSTPTTGEDALLALYNAENPAETWNLNFISGADSASADTFAVRPVIDLEAANSGDFIINDNAYIYTERGAIRVAAGRDMDLIGLPAASAAIVTESMLPSIATYSGDIDLFVGNDMRLQSAVQSSIGEVNVEVGNDIIMDFVDGAPAIRTIGKQGAISLADIEEGYPVISQITPSGRLDIQLVDIDENSNGVIEDSEIGRVTELRNQGLSDAEILQQFIGSPDDGSDGEFAVEIDETLFYWQYEQGGSVEVLAGGSIAAVQDTLVNSEQFGATGNDIAQWDAGYGSANNPVWSANYGGFDAIGPAIVSGENAPTGGIATLGGGDVFVTSGGSFFGQAGTFGGGDLTIVSGQDVDGRFLMYDGEGVIKALGNVGKGFESAGLLSGTISELLDGATIELFDARLDVTAFGGQDIATVANPTMARPGFEAVGAPFGRDLRYQFASADEQDTAVFFRALGGGFTLFGDTSFYSGSSGSRRYMPPKVTIDATGDVFLNQRRYVQAPSFTGGLEIRSGGNIVGSESLLQRGQWAFITIDPNDLYFSSIGDNFKLAQQGEGLGLESYTVPVRRIVQPLEEWSEDALVIEAAGDVGNLVLQLDKQSRILAGNDILNVQFEGQNISDDDTTLVQAGNNIIIRSLSSASNNDGSFTLFGPGVFQMQAGGDINLGTSQTGIELQGSGNRVSLPSQAASLILLAGFTKDLNERDAFNFFQELRVAGVAFTEAQNRDDLSEAARIIEETRENVIAEFFSDAVVNRGDLLMTNSQIGALQETDNLYLFVNGFLDVGRSTGSDSGEAANTGIYTSLGGGINIYADRDINVNESRVMTFNGGDITMWSERGDINAGRGATSAISESPIQEEIDPETGEVIGFTFTPPAVGSGVRALNFDPDASGPLLPPAPGDIFLFAAQGIIDAGEAGISGGNLILGATDVVNAQNISFAGVSVGFSSGTSAAPSVGALSGAGNVESTKNLVEETSDLAADKQKESLSEQLAESSFATKWIRVEFLGFDKEE